MSILPLGLSSDSKIPLGRKSKNITVIYLKYTTLCCFAICTVVIQAGMYEKRLLAHLFNQSRWDAHNPMERPTPIEGKPVEVFLKCYLNQIMDMVSTSMGDLSFHFVSGCLYG